MQEAMRTYLELAMGLTETSRKRVRKVVKDVVKEAVGRSGATADQVKALSGDLMAANSANREALAKLVRFEVDRALGMVGLATADEVEELTRQVRSLQEQLRHAQTGGTSPAATTPGPAGTTRAPAKRTSARATSAKATSAKATSAKATSAKRTAAATTTAPATRTAAASKATVAKKATTARKTTAAKKAGSA
jgi:polyhydroxyalkanoate synthesis regulator phasin